MSSSKRLTLQGSLQRSKVTCTTHALSGSELPSRLISSLYKTIKIRLPLCNQVTQCGWTDTKRSGKVERVILDIHQERLWKITKTFIGQVQAVKNAIYRGCEVMPLGGQVPPFRSNFLLPFSGWFTIKTEAAPHSAPLVLPKYTSYASRLIKLVMSVN